MSPSMMELFATASDKAVVLQRSYRARLNRRATAASPPLQPPSVATLEEVRSTSPTAISAALLASPVGHLSLLPAAETTPKADLYAALQAASFAHAPPTQWLAGAPPPPSGPPPPTTALGTPPPPLPPGPPPMVHGSFSAQSAAAACGLTIQAPGGSHHQSPPYSPGPHSAPPSTGGILPSPPQQPPPPLASPTDGPPQLQRPHSLDEGMLSPHTPWAQSRIQSRLPGMSMGTEQHQAAMGGAMGAMNAMNAMGGGAQAQAQTQQMFALANGGNGMTMTMSGGQLMMNGSSMGQGGANNMMGNGQMSGVQMQISGGGMTNQMQMGMGMGAQMGMGGSAVGGAHAHVHARPPQQPLTPEQQRMRYVSTLVMERLCVWGEYRTVADWPQELVAQGSMPSVHEALQTSPTHSLTIPQLVTAVKERTGNAHGGKALDMLNLKAYVRCFPALFHLRSGRTAAGRPLDVVELRIDCSDGAAGGLLGVGGMAPAAASLQSMSRGRAPASLSMPQLSPLGGGTPQLGQQASWGLGGRAQMPPPPPQHQHQMPGGQPSFGQPSSAPSGLPQMGAAQGLYGGADAPPLPAAQGPASSPGSTLQPKELFASPVEGEASPRNLWGSPALPNGFTLFGGPPAAAPMAAVDAPKFAPTPSAAEAHGRSAAAFDPSAPMEATPPAYADDDDADGLEDDAAAPPSMMMAQLDALFTAGAADADGGADASSDALVEARQAYIKAHSLDKLFTLAVDRAMKHKVASPVEFIAHELMRSAEQMA